MKKKINIAIIGLGTIGGGVVEQLLAKKEYLACRRGGELVLRKICDVDSKFAKKYPKALYTNDYRTILNDESIDIVVELVGGTKVAKDIVIGALKSKKHVVTANKALIADHGAKIIALAKKNNVLFRFEASVCGGIPIVKTLQEGLAANQVESILAIVNGTSNFILTKMRKERCTFESALITAQKLGFAEANPALDIAGKDAAHKLGILSMLSFGYLPKPSEIFTEGIENIQSCDMLYAEEMNCIIKPLAIAKKHKEEIELRVHPTLLPKTHILANVDGEYNAAYVKSDLLGNSLYYGKGAGRYPTAGAVLSDIADVGAQLSHSSDPCTGNGTYLQKDSKSAGSLRSKKIDAIEASYYIRISALDRPGVLTKVSGILAKYDISIASVSQKRSDQSGVVPVVMLTHQANELSARCSIKEIDRLSVIKGNSVVIRMEGTNAT